jgi:cytosine/adenosine deaminase-related metal-dependent hydrolase/ubiquinone/menaquinone biosynthesis C-methylase UbiE
MPVLNKAAEGTAQHSTSDPFALWAAVYDEQANPLLSLEEDFLPCLLPDVRGLDVVDLGCGTGRWLQRFARQHPRSSIGIDSSREMLARAAAKVGHDAVLLRANCVSASLSAGSADLCLASFVLSHVRELKNFARQFAHILRPGGSAFVTDVHPETSAQLGWKRAFRYGEQSIALETHERAIAQVISTLEKEGFEAVLLLEPSFQTHQHQMLRDLQGSQLDDAIFQSPAIYILQLRRSEDRPETSRLSEVPGTRVKGARISFGPHASAVAELNVSGGSVISIESRSFEQSRGTNAQSLDLSGYLLLPGLINSHDHLEFGLFPNLGRGGYQNAAQWAEDIQQRDAAVIAQHRRVPKRVRCWWGAIRNLLCGATTVCHHNPLLAEFSDPDFPVRVLRDYQWAHSLSFDSNVATDVNASDTAKPFIIHAGEGIDEASAEELGKLDRRDMVNDRTVLVHALALNAETLSLINRRRSSVVWCPSSNRFLFGRTLNGDLLSRIHDLVLGSDSAVTSPGDLLDDIRYAYREAGIPRERLYEMVYTAPARVFRMCDGEGSLKPGGVADLIAVRDAGSDPAEVLGNLSNRDIQLVMLRGQVQLARNQILDRVPERLREGLEPLEVDGETVWLRAPVAQLFEEAVSAVEGPIQIGGKRVQCVAID